MILNSKKGNLGVVVIVVTLLFTLVLISVGFTFFTVKPLYEDLSDDLKEDFGTTADEMLDDSTENYPILLDDAFVIVLGGFWMVCLITAWFSRDHPWLVLVLLLLVVLMAGLAAYVSNIWMDYAQSTDKVALKESFPMTDFALSHFVEITLVMGFTALYVVHYRNNAGGGVA